MKYRLFTNKYLKKKISIIIFLILSIILLFPIISYSQDVDNNIDFAIMDLIKRDNKQYKGLDSFIPKYLRIYFNKLSNVTTVENYNATQLINREFSRKEIDNVSSGFLSQVGYYLKSNIILIGEIKTLEDRDWIYLRIRLLDSNTAEVLIGLIIRTPPDKMVFYLNSLFERLIEEINKYHSYININTNIEISNDLREEMRENEEQNVNFSLSYFYIEDTPEQELLNYESNLIDNLRNLGFTNKDIYKGFLKRYTELGLYNKALSFALNIIQDNQNNNRDFVEIFLKSAKELYNVHLYSIAMNILSSVVIHRESDKPLQEIEILNEITKNLIKMDNIEDADRFSIAAKETAEKYGYVPLKLDAMKLYTLVKTRIGLYELSEILLNNSRIETERSGSRLWVANYLIYAGEIYPLMAEFDRALELLTIAENLYKFMGKTEKLIDISIIRINIYKEKEDYKKAIEEINKAIELAIDNKRYIYIREINELMRIVAGLSNERAYTREKEIEFVELFNANSKWIYDRAFLKSLVYFYIFTENYEIAMDIVNKIIKTDKELEFNYNLYENYLLLGDIYNKLEDYDIAFLQYAESLQYAEKTGNQIAQLHSIIELANTFKARGNLEQAISTYQAIVETSKLYGLFTVTEEAYYNLSLIYKELGNKDKYIEHSRNALEVGKRVGSLMVDVYNEPLIGN